MSSQQTSKSEQSQVTIDANNPEETLPTKINDFSIKPTQTTDGTVVYQDDEGYYATVTHTSGDDTTSADHYSLTLESPTRETIQTRTIKYGPQTDRTNTDGIDAIKTQLWEWARYSVSDRHPIHTEIENISEPNPHTPGESPTVSCNVYHDYRPDSTDVQPSDPDGHVRSTYVDTSSYTFQVSDHKPEWYCATLNVSFKNEPPLTVEAKDNAVYGAYIYLSFTPIKPAKDRINKHDTKEINRETILHHNPEEALSHETLLELINNGVEQIRDNAEAIRDEERQQKIKQAQRMYNPETEEYEQDQARLTGY